MRSLNQVQNNVAVANARLVRTYVAGNKLRWDIRLLKLARLITSAFGIGDQFQRFAMLPIGAGSMPESPRDAGPIPATSRWHSAGTRPVFPCACTS